MGDDSEARRRLVVVRNPEEADKDRRKREDTVAEAQRLLDKAKVQREERFDGKFLVSSSDDRLLAEDSVGIHGTRSGEVWQTGTPTADQTRLFEALCVAPPPCYYALPKPGRRPA